MTCQHCEKEPANRPKQLCWRCYCNPKIRNLYISKSKYARRGNGVETTHHPLSEQPIEHLPKTAEKIEEMRKRMIRGEQLFHPDDLSRPLLDEE